MLKADDVVLSAAGPAVRPPDVSIVVPSFNERDNIPELVRRVEATMGATPWEMIVVDDDSPDGTHALVKSIGAQDPRIRCIRRIGRRGLAGACIEGILSSSAPVVAVMDADLQHDETLLPRMLEAVQGGADLAVGSRFVEGGTTGEGLSDIRRRGSEFAISLAKRILGVHLEDPMSGFFMLRRETFEGIAGKLSRQGYKILLDIVSNAPGLSIVELPMTFRERHAGASKLDSLVTAEYLGLLFSRVSGGVLPVRFLMFAAVGFSGVAVHLAALQAALGLPGLGFEWAQFLATMVAMTWNYILNNQLTYRDRRLKGLAFLGGLITFYAACSMGTVANVGVASWIHAHDATPLVAGLAGAIMGAVFNYAASSILIWKEK